MDKDNNKLALFFVGKPLSGKTTLANDIISNYSNFIHLNSDAIRKELFAKPNSYDKDQNIKAFTKLKEAMKEAIESGLNIVYDVTNSIYEYRKKDKEFAEKLGARVVYVYFDVDNAELERRRVARNKKRDSIFVSKNDLDNWAFHILEKDEGEQVVFSQSNYKKSEMILFLLLKNMNKSGFIIIDKPAGITSHDVIYRLRRITGIKKIGHAGTLDPIATGVLICAIGREATKEISKFVKMDKEYVSDMVLGATSDTYDREGLISPSISLSLSSSLSEQVIEFVKNFQGKQKQIPPMYSAKKVKGKKLYELARKGIEIEREPSDIEIYSIKVVNYEWPELVIKVNCTSGTYVRSLVHDIGKKLGCGAYMKELRRTAIGDYGIGQAVRLSALSSDDWSDYIISV